MKFIISGKNIELTQALKDYAEEKIGKLEQVIEGELEAIITMSTERNLQIVEIQLNARAETYRGSIEDSDMYAAIDRLVDVLLGQVRKTKAKKEKMLRSEDLRDLSSNTAVEKDTVKGEIIKYETYSLKPMGEEDAKIILQETNDVFFTFVNIDTNKVNVIFRTKDGNFGIIEPNS